jgi:imidazolonepropionase
VTAAAPLLFVDAAEVVTCAGPAAARRGAAMADAGVRRGVAVLVRDGRVAAIDAPAALRRDHPDATVVDCAGGVLTPGLVDSHTHAVFAAPRAAEHELRASGVGYLEIAARGGGIHRSVRDLRATPEDTLVADAVARLAVLPRHGVTTIEIKSGYGLSLDAERTQLRAIARVAATIPQRVVPTCLAAHEVPLEFRDRPDGRAEYVRLVAEEILPAVARERLATFADVFCEPGVFTAAEARTVLDAAAAVGLGRKLHADELHDGDGAALAVAVSATSADHLAAISATGIAALAAAPTVATLLPATMLFLGRDRQAPARPLIEAGAAVALATDFNPGTSPTLNLPLVLTLGVSVLHLSAAEALVAATVNGAAASGLADRTGQVAPGYDADLALWGVPDHREIPYWYGAPPCTATWVRGKLVTP